MALHVNVAMLKVSGIWEEMSHLEHNVNITAG